MRVSIGATITVENPSKALNDWCEEHLVIPNPEYAKKVRMHFWVGNTPKTLSLYERRGNALILPFGILRDVQHFLWGHPCTSEFPEPVEIAYSGEVPLYSYQDDAVNVVKECRYGILQSPAGSGKTQMGIALVMRYGRRALWLTHTTDLLNQSKARAERYMDKRLIGTITEGKVNIGQGITFATIQTMCKLDLPQYKDLWDVIIVDECFPAGSQIQTPHGTVPIQFICPGELVLTRNEFSGKLEFCEVEELQVRSAKKLLKVTSSNGQSVICTPNHPFYTRNGYRKAADLKNGDEVYLLREGVRPVDMEPYPTIRNSKGRTLSVLFQRMFRKSSERRYEKDGIFEWVRVESIEILKPRSDGTFGDLCPGNCVYNLAVKHNHNYFANGFAVHNCHRVAGTPTSVTQFSKVLNSLAARHKYGLSATVHRADGMIAATYALLGRVVYTVPDEAVKDKIMKVGIKPLGTGVKLSRECLNTDGTINYTKLINYLCENKERTHYIGSWIVAEADHPCLILSDRLNHLEALMNTLPHSMREMSVMISGKMTTKKGKAEREQAIEDMRTGRKRYLFATYSLAREGLDIPCLERLFLTTPQKDYAVITQSIGRIARTHEGKKPPIAYDFVDDIGFLVKSYKKRCSTYRKNGCYFEEDA